MSKEALAQSFADKERKAGKEMVTEADLTAQIEELGGKIDALDLPDKFKNDIKDKLDAVIEARDEEVKNLDAHAEQLLKDAFGEIKVELQNFLEQPDVKEIVETITPFIAKKDKILPHIDLISYESKSGHYQAINRKLQEDAGITPEQISSLQKLIGVTVDGKVGPETINAMGKQLYERDFSVQFSSETKYRDPAYVAPQVPPQSPPQAPPSAPKTPKLPERGPKLSSAMQALKQRAAQIDKSVTGAEKTLAQRNRDVARAQEVLAQEQGQDMDEGTSWYEVFVPDNDESVDASVQTLTAMEELRDKAQQELNTLQQERKTILKETFVQYYCEGHKDPDFFLMVYRKLRDDLPDELKAPVQQAIQQRLASKDCTPFERAWLTGSYDEALQAATDEHKQKNVGKYFRNLSEHDIIEAYEQAKNNPDKRRTDFPAGSFAAQKLDEGFIALKIANTSAAVLAREGQGGALEYYIATREGYELTMSKAAGLKTISKAEQTQLKSSVAKTRQDMETLIDCNPTFERLRNVSNLLQAKLRPLQNLMVAGFSADKTEEFVKTARRYANDIRHSSELRELKSLMPETKAQLRILKGFSFGAHDEFEKRIIAMEEQFSSIADSVESGKLDDLCKFITSSDFDPATWQNWLIKYGIPMGFAILGGVLCMVTFGAGVPAVATIGAMLGIGKVGATIVVGAIGLAKVAAAGAVGGMIGQEVGHVVSEVGVRAFTDNDNFQNRSLLGKYVMDDKVFNPETGSYDEIKLGDVAKYYSANFVKSFALTFGLLGLGKLIGPFLTRFVDKFKTANGFSTEGLKGGVARLMARLPRLGQSEIDLLKRGGTGNMMKKVAEEFLEESGEETAEGVAEKIHPALGFLASLYFCLSTSNVQYKFGKFAVAEVSREQNSDKNLVTTWSYNADSAADLFSTLESEYNNQGYEVTQDDDGTIHLTTDYTTKDGETLKNTMVFKPLKESVEMRRLLSINRDGDGQSEIERYYGVATTAENEYAFENLTAAGRITLPQYLEQNGFKIHGKPKNGEFTATKGGETLRFKQKEGVQQEVKQEVAESSIKTSEEILSEYAKQEQPQLTKEILESGLFEIKNTVSIGGITFHFGPIFKTSKKGELMCVVMVDTGNGILLPRLMYKSNSQGAWRGTKGMKFDRISKGKFEEIAYTQETILHPTLEKYLSSAEASGKIEQQGKDILDYFALIDAETIGANPKMKEVNTYDNEVELLDDGGLLGPFQNEQYKPGQVNGPNASEHLRSLDKSYPKGFIPDFKKGPIDKRKSSHPIFGETTIESYQGKLNGSNVEWEMEYDKSGRVWIRSISCSPRKTNSYGINPTVIHSGVLTYKPADRFDQIKGLRGDEMADIPGQGRYADITPLIDNLLPIRQFREARGISRGSSVDQEAHQDQQKQSISMKDIPMENCVSIGALCAWLEAQGVEYNGYNTAEQVANIKAYAESKGTTDPGNITNAGGLRTKVVEMVEIANFLEFEKQVSAEKRPYDARLKQEPRLGNANQVILGMATRSWLTSRSADANWGSIIDQEHVDLMQRSNPREMEMKFRNGTTVTFIFPANYEGDIKRLQKDLVKAEQWVQQQFGEYNIRPPKGLTVLLMQGTARKPIRGHAGTADVIMDVDSLRNPQDFLETYMHERTHTILNSSYNPYNGGLVEGIANYMAATGSQALAFGKPRIARRSVRNISQEILALVRGGASFELAFWQFFNTQHGKDEYHLNYEYGQAFSEVFLKHFGGNMRRFIDLYAELSNSKYVSMPVSTQLYNAMLAIGISEDDAGAIAKQAAGLLMLKACKGNDLLSVLMQESPDRIKSILSEQTLTNIFGLDQPTTNALAAHVHRAIEFIVANQGFMNKKSAATLIEILESKLKAIQDNRGLLAQTQHVPIHKPGS